jgi:hypothetical protein
VARARSKAKTSKKAEVVEDELEELEDLEDLEDEPVDEADEDEDEDEAEDEDEDEEDTPKAKKKSSRKPKKRDDGMIGSAELAEALGTSGRELRVMLRQHKVEKNENNRYEWDSVEDAVSEMGFKSIAAAKKGLAESRAQRLDELKERVGKNKKKKASSKAGTKKSKKVVEEDEEDFEDEDDE